MRKHSKVLAGGLAFSLLLSQGVYAAEAKGKTGSKGKKPVVTDKNRDGIPDAWELKHKLGLGKDVAKKDSDGDGLTNLTEYQLSLNPRSVDTDRDGVRDGSEDFDQDKLTNMQELQAKLNPAVADTDRDRVSDAKEDNDRDGLITMQEFVVKTNPLVADTDQDMLKDGAEDRDTDSLSNILEFQLKLDPTRTDSDRDGLLDSEEDTDQDGLTNEAEVEIGQNPADSDSDNDGVTDSREDTNRDGIVNSAELKELKIEMKLPEGSVEIKYSREKGKLKTQVEDETGRFGELNVQSFVKELALQPTMKQEDVLARIKQVLGIEELQELEVKGKFCNGTKLKVEDREEGQDHEDQEQENEED